MGWAACILLLGLQQLLLWLTGARQRSFLSLLLLLPAMLLLLWPAGILHSAVPRLAIHTVSFLQLPLLLLQLPCSFPRCRVAADTWLHLPRPAVPRAVRLRPQSLPHPALRRLLLLLWRPLGALLLLLLFLPATLCIITSRAAAAAARRPLLLALHRRLRPLVLLLRRRLLLLANRVMVPVTAPAPTAIGGLTRCSCCTGGRLLSLLTTLLLLLLGGPWGDRSTGGLAWLLLLLLGLLLGLLLWALCTGGFCIHLAVAVG
jgi:hypothetical protein